MTEQQRKAAAVVMASDGPWDVYEGPTRGWAPVDGTPLWDWEDHTYRIRPEPAPAPLPCPCCGSDRTFQASYDLDWRECRDCWCKWNKAARR